MKFSLSYLVGQVPDEAWSRLYSPLVTAPTRLPDECIDPSSKGYFINNVLGEDPVVSGARSPLLATEGDIVLCASQDYVDGAVDCPCSVAVVSDRLDDLGLSSLILKDANKVIIQSSSPRLLLAYLLQPFLDKCCAVPLGENWGNLSGGNTVDIHDSALVAPTSTARHATIGKNCIIHPNVVIGCDGFGFERDPANGAVLKMPHFGRVIIGDNVEIFPFVNIPRGSLDDTVIGDNVKIDALCHIAHNVKIGAGSLVIANSMIAGSVRIGERAWIAPSTSVNNGAHIGDGAMTGTGSVVTKPVDDNSLVYGVPARHKRYLQK